MVPGDVSAGLVAVSRRLEPLITGSGEAETLPMVGAMLVAMVTLFTALQAPWGSWARARILMEEESGKAEVSAETVYVPAFPVLVDPSSTSPPGAGSTTPLLLTSR